MERQVGRRRRHFNKFSHVTVNSGLYTVMSGRVAARLRQWLSCLEQSRPEMQIQKPHLISGISAREIALGILIVEVTF